jgi:mono/diheme cytochrome c family protein
MLKRFCTLSLIFSFILLSACHQDEFKEGKIFAGDKYVTAKTLNYGKKVYTESCMPCHGVKGDGKGVASKGMTVPPRDFRLGVYKFGEVMAGELPHDSHLKKLLVEGLEGTAMLPWDMQDGAMDAVIQYIKTFAPKVWEGKGLKLGEQMTLNKDPYGLAHESSAVKRGKEVYHVVAECQSCHRAYVSRSEMNFLSQKLTGDGITEFEDDLYKVKPQESEYNVKTIPPDFTWHSVRSAQTVKELAIRIAAGVGGTGMPNWKETISDDDIWAVSYYVKYLMNMKDNPNRSRVVDGL